MRFLKFLFITISIFLFFWLAYWSSDTFFEPKAYNYMVKTFTANKHGSDNIVLIVIDDKSIGRHRWPWKRSLYCPIYDYFKELSSSIQIRLTASLGILQSPLGERQTEPTFGPSGRQFRLNC